MLKQIPRSLKQFQPAAEKLQKELEKQKKSNLKILEFLISRGIDTPEKYRKLMDYSLSDIPDIYKFKDGKKAIDRILQAINNHEKILVYGDYDVDGIMATSIVLNTLRDLKVDCDYFINDRFKHGFGICVEGIETALQKFDADLIITVDNGITGIDGIARANELGKTVIVTDHHMADEKLPEAYALLDAHLESDEVNYKDMCGAGLAFLIMLEIYHLVKNVKVEDLFENNLFKHNLCCAAFATKCDVMPLLDYNRYILKRGLKVLNESEPFHSSWTALKQCIYDINKGITADTFGFTWGPMVNACQRIDGDVTPAVELMTIDSTEIATEKVLYLSELNEKRKEATQNQGTVAKADIKINNREDKAVNIVYGPQYDEGIVGILAGDLKKTTNKLSFVFGESADHKDWYKGSARSIDSIDVKAVLDTMPELFVAYGGHKGAAGLTIEKSKMEEFVKRIDAMFEEKDVDFYEYIDFVLFPEMLTPDFVTEFKELEPFGEKFEEPKVCVRGVVTNTSYLKDGAHTKLQLDNALDTLWWKHSSDANDEMLQAWPGEAMYDNCPVVNVFGHPEINVFRGIIKTQMIIDSVTPWLYKDQLSIKTVDKKIKYVKKMD